MASDHMTTGEAVVAAARRARSMAGDGRRQRMRARKVKARHATPPSGTGMGHRDRRARDAAEIAPRASRPPKRSVEDRNC
eukprot:5355288-Prymnesium_polylepis.1